MTMGRWRFLAALDVVRWPAIEPSPRATVHGMSQFLIGSIATILLGAVGWIALFIARPIRNFLRLRGEIRHETVRLANVSRPDLTSVQWQSGNEAERENTIGPIREAQTIILSLGARSMSFGEFSGPANLCLKHLGFNPAAAGRALVDLSDSYWEESERDEHRAVIAKALRYPL